MSNDCTRTGAHSPMRHDWSAFVAGTIRRDPWGDDTLEFFGDGVVEAWSGTCRDCHSDVTYRRYRRPRRMSTEAAIEMSQELRHRRRQECDRGQFVGEVWR